MAWRGHLWASPAHQWCPFTPAFHTQAHLLLHGFKETVGIYLLPFFLNQVKQRLLLTLGDQITLPPVILQNHFRLGGKRGSISHVAT